MNSNGINIASEQQLSNGIRFIIVNSGTVYRRYPCSTSTTTRIWWSKMQFPGQYLERTIQCKQKQQCRKCYLLGATGDLPGELLKMIHTTVFTGWNNQLAWPEGMARRTIQQNRHEHEPDRIVKFPIKPTIQHLSMELCWTESVTTVPGNMVDWVLVELRDAPTAGQATSDQNCTMTLFWKKMGQSLDWTEPHLFNSAIQ